MPSMLSANDRHITKTVIISSTKILAASLARVYLAYPEPFSWSYSGLQRAFLLVADSGRGAHLFCLVDLVGSRGKLWEHEIYRGFKYNQDRVFNSFAGDVRVTLPCSTTTNIRGTGMHDRFIIPH